MAVVFSLGAGPMTITLPESHRRWLEEQAARDGSTIDRVVAELIEEAWESDEVEAKVLEAVKGRPAEPMTAGDWERLRKRITDRSPTSSTP
jgi:hypothetical protein